MPKEEEDEILKELEELEAEDFIEKIGKETEKKDLIM